MIIYLQSINYDSWQSIENRPHKPAKIENNITFPKAMIIPMMIKSFYIWMLKLCIFCIVHLVEVKVMVIREAKYLTKRLFEELIK